MIGSDSNTPSISPILIFPFSTLISHSPEQKFILPKIYKLGKKKNADDTHRHDTKERERKTRKTFLTNNICKLS